MDFISILPEAARLLNVQPSVLLFWLFIIVQAARAVSRSIPDTATGFAGFVRRLTAIVGVEVPTKVAPGVTVKDVAKAALATPPIPETVEEQKVGDGFTPVTIAANGSLTGGGNGQVTPPRP